MPDGYMKRQPPQEVLDIFAQPWADINARIREFQAESHEVTMVPA